MFSATSVWLIWKFSAPFIMQIFKLEKSDFFFLLNVDAPTPQDLLKSPSSRPLPPWDNPSHSPATMPLFLLHHTFQGSLLLWDYGADIHILLPVQTQLQIPQTDAHRHQATLVANTELVSKSRWHIRVMPNSAWPLQCVKATRSMTSVLAMENWSLSRCLLLSL